MRNIYISLLITCVVGCSSAPLRGKVEDGKYSNIQNSFEMSVPELVNVKVVDGSRQYFSFVDFTSNEKSYSIEVFDRAGPDTEESFKASTESFMKEYIPNKCGPDSFDYVTGEFTKISDNISYDFVTKGIRPNGQLTFLYGRSIFLAPKKVAICMLYKDRKNDESIINFEANFNKREFDDVCSSIKIKI